MPQAFWCDICSFLPENEILLLSRGGAFAHFLKPYHDEVFVSKRKPTVLSSLLRIRNGMNRLIENISSINPLFARPSGAFNTPDNVAKGFFTLSTKHLVL